VIEREALRSNQAGVKKNRNRNKAKMESESGLQEGILRDAKGNEFRLTKKKLGRGTFADVFLGEWLNHTPVMQVAIKQFHLNKQTYQRALATEISIMQTLDHPNIVKLVSVIKHVAATKSDDSSIDDDDDDQLWVVLEYCEGGDFKTFLKDKNKSPKQQRLSEKYACLFMRQIAEGLRYLRSRQIVHRDLKPHNLLLSKDQRTVKIADFGFARILGSDALEATVCGSPLYMAPEILCGTQYNSKADLWSVGVILYEMLCGARPFQEVKDIVDLRRRVDKDPIQFPTRVQISRECRRLLVALLQKDPEKRIDWQDFFEHEWLTTDYTIIHSRQLQCNIPSSAPIKIPSSSYTSTSCSAPTRSMPKMRIISNYTSSSSRNNNKMIASVTAPARVDCALFHSYTPDDFGTTPDSMFLGATATSHSRTTGSHSRSRSHTDTSNSVEHSSSFRQSLSDVFSTGFGLLKESFHGH
jgi:serine/threonine protein kinase